MTQLIIASPIATDNDHVNAKQQSAQAVEKPKAAHGQSMQANNKSQQQK
jgi:hypothetical protein